MKDEQFYPVFFAVLACLAFAFTSMAVEGATNAKLQTALAVARVTQCEAVVDILEDDQ